MIKMTLTVPVLKVDIKNKKDVLQAIGEMVKGNVKDRINSGLDAKDKALHEPLDGGQPMNRTGLLKDSITVKNNGKTATVFPDGSRQNGRKKVRNGKVAGVLSVPDQRNGSNRPAMIVFDWNNKDMEEAGRIAANKADLDLVEKTTKEIKIG